MITLYQLELSPYCDKVRRILNFKGVPYETREVSMLDGSKHSPTGKLPVLELRGQRIDDSTQIAHALELHFPEPPLIPRAPAERALCHMLEDWADESLYFYEMALNFTLEENARPRLEALTERDSTLRRALIKRAFPPALRHILRAQGTGRRSRARLLEDVARHVQAIADLLEDRPYLIGRELSLADISVSCQLTAMCATPQGREACALHENVVRWQARVRARTEGEPRG